MTASEHRTIARNTLKGNWLLAVLTGLVASLTGAITASSGGEFDFKITESIPLENVSPSLAGILTPLLGWVLGAGLVTSIVATVIQLVVGGAVGIGYRQYLLNLIDGESAEFDQLFSRFRHMGQAVLLRVLRWAVTAIPLGVTTLLIPVLMTGLDLLTLGIYVLILAAACVSIYVDYGFAMAEFVMAEQPGCAAVDGLKRSWDMMNGNRFRLFCLNFSFIGWSILAGLTFGIGGLFLTPYVQTANASFYRELQPRMGPGYSTFEALPQELL